MNQSFENENACDVFMNKIRIKDGIQEMLEGSPSLQTKERKNPKIMQKNEREYAKVTEAKNILETILQNFIVLNILMCQ